MSVLHILAFSILHVHQHIKSSYFCGLKVWIEAAHKQFAETSTFDYPMHMQVSRHFPVCMTDLPTKTQLQASLWKLSNKEGWSHTGKESLQALPCSVRPALLQIPRVLKELETIQQQTSFGLITIKRESSLLAAYIERPGSSTLSLRLLTFTGVLPVAAGNRPCLAYNSWGQELCPPHRGRELGQRPWI